MAPPPTMTAIEITKPGAPEMLKPGTRPTPKPGAGEVLIEVTDDGVAPAAASQTPGGHGLAGMRERVALFGGELSAGPRPCGGFGVQARLPLDDHPYPARPA